MNTITLCRFACSDVRIQNTFGGVYASDRLPKFKRKFSTFIANLDPHTLPGSHWVAIFFRNKKAYYFDSYGFPPSNKKILHFLKTNSNCVFYNRITFQDVYTTTCGYFCLYFLFQCVREFDMDDLDLNNKKKNELFIRKFVQQKFKKHTCCHFAYNKKQKCLAWINMHTTHSFGQ